MTITATNEKNNISIITAQKCCSCGACFNKCPSKAIKMCENDEGFLVPVIDEEKCTNCGLCTMVCPTINPEYKNNNQPKIYAAMGDYKLRMKSSSGGLFTLLAENIIKKGGYVCGAAYTKEWSVEHIIVDNIKDLEKLRKSKYMQSNTNNVFQEIKTLLDNNKYVLFSGCPCQVAGLKKYLEKSYENLLTIDLVCHGVPSPKVFRKFLKENYNNEITDIDFREKEVFGWTTPTVIKYKNGEIYRKAFNECSYFRGFLANLFLNKPCGDCQFNKIPRQGDITLGDFWLIGEYNKEYTDGKGTGIVLINNKKGQSYIEEIKKSLNLFKEVPMDFALKSNPNLNCSFKHHKNRELFFDYIQNNTYQDAFKYCIGEKYDVGVIGLGFAKNYGAALTNFGLVKTLEKLGKRVIVLDKPIEYQTVPNMNIARKFTHKHFNMSKQYSKKNITEFNNLCDTFIIGSDQVWHWNILEKLGKYFLLEFASEDKRKIAYASSFGHYKFSAPYSHIRIFSHLLSRFDAISVREVSGIDICKQMGIEAKNVLDPVFLCDREEYIRIAQSVEPRLLKNKYIFTYILDPHLGDKKNILLKTSKYLHLPLVNITDYNHASENEKRLGLATEKNFEIEDFLSNLCNSKVVITDSFHGVCFAIIFRKNFVCIVNKHRGTARFESLLYRLNLQDRMFYNVEDFYGNEEILNKEIDYDAVYEIIEREKEYSFEFLKAALNKEKNVCPNSAFDNYTDMLQISEITDMKSKIEYNNACLALLMSSRRIHQKYYRYKILSKVLIGKKRLHYKSKTKIWHEKIRKIRQIKKELSKAAV